MSDSTRLQSQAAGLPNYALRTDIWLPSNASVFGSACPTSNLGSAICLQQDSRECWFFFWFGELHAALKQNSPLPTQFIGVQPPTSVNVHDAPQWRAHVSVLYSVMRNGKMLGISIRKTKEGKEREEKGKGRDGKGREGRRRKSHP